MKRLVIGFILLAGFLHLQSGCKKGEMVFPEKVLFRLEDSLTGKPIPYALLHLSLARDASKPFELDLENDVEWSSRVGRTDENGYIYFSISEKNIFSGIIYISHDGYQKFNYPEIYPVEWKDRGIRFFKVAALPMVRTVFIFKTASYRLSNDVFKCSAGDTTVTLTGPNQCDSIVTYTETTRNYPSIPVFYGIHSETQFGKKYECGYMDSFCGIRNEKVIIR